VTGARDRKKAGEIVEIVQNQMGGRYEPIGKDLRGSSLEARAGGELIPGLLLALNQKSSSAPK
jgi:hypothetical protein